MCISLLINCGKFFNIEVKWRIKKKQKKAHGDKSISIRMLKICGSSICKTLEVIFKQFSETDVFPSEWK